MKKGTVLIIAGIVLLASAAGLTFYNMYTADAAYKDAVSALDKLVEMMPNNENIIFPNEDATQSEAEKPSDDTPASDGEAQAPDAPETHEPIKEPEQYVPNVNMEMPTVEIDGFDYLGVIEIPDISLRLPVISKMSHSRLKKAPCRYSGTAYADDFIIGAHCYDRFFARLGDVPIGGQIKFIDVNGNLFVYTVFDKETIPESDAKGLKSGDWELSLFTCPSLVNIHNRIVLRCERIYPSK